MVMCDEVIPPMTEKFVKVVSDERLMNPPNFLEPAGKNNAIRLLVDCSLTNDADRLQRRVANVTDEPKLCYHGR